MKVTEDMRDDRDWLVQTLNRTVGGSQADTKVAWSDLGEAGWTDVFARISGTWTQFEDSGRPTNRMPFRSCAALLQVCGVFKAGLVLAALDLWVASPDGARQPSPADLFQLIAQPQSAREGAANLPHDLRRDQQPEVLALVSSMVADGEPVCDCSRAPMTLVMDARGCLFCPECAGIEAGQALAADDHLRPFVPGPDTPVEELSAILRLKRIRGARAARSIEERRGIAA